MSKVRVDFSQAKDFEALPAGSYPVVVEETEVCESNSSEYPYIKWTLKVETGEFAGRKLWTNNSINPKAAWSLKDALRAFGEDPKKIDVDSLDIDPDDYVGRRCIANVSQETYNNRLQNTVDNLVAVAAGQSNRAPAGIR